MMEYRRRMLMAAAMDKWDGVLYDAGDLRTDITGGWSSTGYTSPGAIITNGALNSSNMTVTAGKSPMVGQLLGTQNAIDLTPYSTIHIRASVTGTGVVQYFGGYYQKIAPDSKNDFLVMLRTQQLSPQEYTADISTVSGMKYIAVECLAYGGYYNSTIEVYKIWLT